MSMSDVRATERYSFAVPLWFALAIIVLGSLAYALPRFDTSGPAYGSSIEQASSSPLRFVFRGDEQKHSHASSHTPFLVGPSRNALYFDRPDLITVVLRGAEPIVSRRVSSAQPRAPPLI